MKDSKLKDQYCEFREAYQRLGYMTVVPLEQDDRQEGWEFRITLYGRIQLRETKLA